MTNLRPNNQKKQCIHIKKQLQKAKAANKIANEVISNVTFCSTFFLHTTICLNLMSFPPFVLRDALNLNSYLTYSNTCMKKALEYLDYPDSRAFYSPVACTLKTDLNKGK